LDGDRSPGWTRGTGGFLGPGRVPGPFLVGSDSIETVKKTHGHYFTAGAVITLPELAAT